MSDWYVGAVRLFGESRVAVIVGYVSPNIINEYGRVRYLAVGQTTLDDVGGVARYPK